MKAKFAIGSLFVLLPAFLIATHSKKPVRPPADLRDAVSALEQLAPDTEKAAVPEGNGAPKLGGIYGRVEWIAKKRAELPVAPKLPMPKKKWTVMAFINGSNNLGESVLANDLAQMSSVGTTDNMNLVVDLGLSSGEKMSLVQRMLLLPARRAKQINPVVYAAEINRDMGAWANAADFIRWAKTNFPADRYMFIIGNHGGMVDGISGISFDDTSGNFIRVHQLSPLFKRAGRVDMFVLDSCLMQTAEVAYQVGEKADVIIGSEEIDWSDMSQYLERLKYLTAHSDESTEEIAAAFVKMRREKMAGDKRYTTLSAVRGSGLRDLPAALNAWTAAVMKAGKPPAVVEAVTRAARFFGPMNHTDYANSQLVDLGDFAGRVSLASKDDGIKESTDALLKVISKAVIANSAVGRNSEGVDFGKAVKGLSIRMIPLAARSPGRARGEAEQLKQHATPGVDYAYRNLRLFKESGSNWPDFLEWTRKIYTEYQLEEIKY
jgi:hypothetical protein